MVLSAAAAERATIEVLHNVNSWGGSLIVKEFPNKNWAISSINRLIKNDTDSSSRNKGSGRPKIVRSKKNIDYVMKQF